MSDDRGKAPQSIPSERVRPGGQPAALEGVRHYRRRIAEAVGDGESSLAAGQHACHRPGDSDRAAHQAKQLRSKSEAGGLNGRLRLPRAQGLAINALSANQRWQIHTPLGPPSPRPTRP